MFDFVKRAAGRALDRVVQSALKARYDLAQNTGANAKHFANADRRTPINTNTRFTRQQIAMKCRYEWQHNSYLEGLVRTLATDVIGYTAPTLRVMCDEPGVLPKESVKYLLESRWEEWSKNRYVNLPEKLYLLDSLKTVEGESFWYRFTDEDAEDATGLSLNCQILPTRRIQDPYVRLYNAIEIEPVYRGSEYVRHRKTINDDGVIVDAKNGIPVRFKVTNLEAEVYGFDIIKTPEIIDGRHMTQWFHPSEAGQYRGVSEVKSAVPIYAQLRRYLTTVMTGAETAASFAGVLETTNPPTAEGMVEIDQFTQFPLTPGMLISLPEGWKASQFQANTNIVNVQATIDLALRECGRALDVPFGVVAGDSSKYNYSSARLDYTGYDERMKYRRGQLSTKILNPTFNDFLVEMALRHPQVMEAYKAGKISHSWTYSTRPSIDPQKDAATEDVRLKNGTTTLAEVYASRGLDWEEQLEQRQREFTKISVLGIDFNTQTAIMVNEGVDNAQSSQPTNETNPQAETGQEQAAA